MNKTPEELDKLFKEHGVEGTQSKLDQKIVVDERDVASLKTMISNYKSSERARLEEENFSSLSLMSRKQLVAQYVIAALMAIAIIITAIKNRSSILSFIKSFL